MVVLPVSGKSQTYEVRPSKIIALGLNYRSHIAESHSVKVSGFTEEIPKEPILFPKTPNVLTGPGDPIVIPAFLLDYGFEDLRTDYEAELAVIIGKECKNVKAEEALDYVFGYTCINDVSQRNIQSGDRSGWFRGKSLDTFGPIGPRIVLREEVDNPQSLHLQCRLNGKTVQDASTSQMIFSIASQIEFISKNFTLLPGDIIATGTPGGVGRIRHGDVVEVEIEKIGVLSNPVVEEWMR
ncbi:MAG: fumarylacetoacetate hydrolase family protein [Syntrophobacteraceae bacterium]|nr:fumarylacetoacetate hydrolase family protein [Syntrophobacteraceae bacterium]